MSLKLEAPAVSDRRGRTRVLIVRHAQSTFNEQQRYQGRSDEPVLTNSGTAAARQAGRYLATERVDAIISSPLRRALETAGIITATLREGGHPESGLSTSDDLREIDLQEWEGLALEAVRQQFPESHQIWNDQPHEFRMSAKGGATFFPVRELFGQVNRFWRGFLARHAGQTVVLVTHGGAASALISTAVGVKPERFHALQHSNCGISILEFPAGSSTAQIEALNLTSHLGERMPKLKLGRRGVRIVMVASDAPGQQIGHVSGISDAVQLDFVFSADDPQSTGMAYALIETHPDAQLSVLPTDVLTDWRHTAETRLTCSIASCHDSLSTGILVARNSELDSILSAVLGMEGKSSRWKHSSNAVLHYPEAGRTPVIQAVNIPVCKEVVEPVTAEAGT
jgi:phosphoserine phosphatase